jgi:IS30 family transposase
MPTGGDPWDANRDREQVRELHAKGKSRNDIAREINRPPSTVSKIWIRGYAETRPVSSQPETSS